MLGDAGKVVHLFLHERVELFLRQLQLFQQLLIRIVEAVDRLLRQRRGLVEHLLLLLDEFLEGFVELLNCLGSIGQIAATFFARLGGRIS